MTWQGSDFDLRRVALGRRIVGVFVANSSGTALTEVEHSGKIYLRLGILTQNAVLRLVPSQFLALYKWIPLHFLTPQ